LLVAAHPLELPLLQDAQHLGLHGRRHVPHLVEEEGAAVGQLELPLAGRHRAGEGAALVAEELALHQLGRHRRAVHLHEGAALAPRALVEGPGHQLLAGAVLPGDQHPALGGRGPPHQLAQPLHGRRGAEELPGSGRPAQLGVLGREVPQGEPVADRGEQPLPLADRLFEVIERPELEGLAHRLDGPVAAHHHHREARAGLQGPLQHLESVQVGELHVEEHEIDRQGGDALQRLLAGAGRLRGVALQGQGPGKRHLDVPLVVDDEHQGGHAPMVAGKVLI
jgi:hypothetical protein